MVELEVTQIWMGGIVTMMLIFSAFALFGYLKADGQSSSHEEKEKDLP